MSTDDLLEKFVHYLKLFEGTEHWGRQKRFTVQKDRVLEALKSRADGTPRLLLPLRKHEDPVVRLSATILCKSLDPSGCREIMETLAKDEGPIGQRASYTLANDAWRERRPLTSDWSLPGEFRGRSALDVPTGMTRAELDEYVRAEFPEDLARQVLALALPAIGMWPRRLQEGADHRTSRLGGMPLVPEQWIWPRLEDEPMLFVSQINCAELVPLSSASIFPSRGLISFFAEHDYLHCCTAGLETECCAVFYWPDPDRLTTPSEPIEDFEQLRRCGLGFYETLSLPDPRSERLELIPFNGDQRQRYAELHRAVRGHGVPDPMFDEFKVIKLLGWPDLIQHDLTALREPKRLLLQLGNYDDGTDLQHWGPGGAVYFSIPDADLPNQRFDRVQLDVQIT
ncbi:MAG TPA: DUF1963 domain-containing protein [Stellaceae bacterium]|nr:DUF1963 domain-containing protein [Stellaceae bacterium]